jgi:glycosyltransferase involved in cell wall biosynthesis
MVINDGSTDNTVRAAIDAGVDIVVSHVCNVGVCSAYETACHMALEYGADIFCSIDADGQFNPSEIDRLLEPIAQDEADVVIGSRFLREDSLTCVPTLNRITNCMIARIVSFLMGVRLHDVESGFRAISKEAAKSLELMCVGSFSHDMLLDLSSKGFRIKEVPVSVTYYRNRTSRVVKNLLRYGLKSAFSIAVKVLTLKGVLKQTPKTNFTTKVVHESVRAVRSKEVQRLARINHHE